MKMNEKPVYWASNARLNEPERILKEQGWQKGSRPAASDFNWLFNTIQKDLHMTQVQLKEIKEKLDIGIKALNKDVIDLKGSTAEIKETAEHSLADSHSNRDLSRVSLRSIRDLHLGLNELVNELRHFNPNLRSRTWGFKDDFDLIDEGGLRTEDNK